jgi:exodeoxyribonuclease V alpha subunit
VPPDPLEGIVVVDEFSMVDIALMHRLLTNALDDTIFLFVGDKDQLPSVSPGAVLRDLLSCGTVATTTLTEVFRQAAQSDIVVNAHAINRGGLTRPNEWSMSKPEVDSDFVTCYAYDPDQHIDTLRWWITKYCPENGIDPMRDVQVMIPQKTGQVGVHAINAFMQRTLNPNPNSFINRPGDEVWGVGDRLMNLKNNYDLDIYNGDIGTLVDVVWEGDGVVGAIIDFDGNRIEVPKSWFGCITLSYAMTIHKSQGSEYPFVIMLLHTSHHTLLQRNIVYTAVTRARQQVVAIAHPQALAIALRSVNAQERNTYLAERLQGEPALVAA